MTKASGPDTDGLTDALHRLGFTGYEAKVYVALLRFNPATAYEISKQIGLQRANVYDAIASLERKLAVQPVNENPIRYVPVDPRRLLARIQQDTAQRCDLLAEQLAALHLPVATEFVWTISGSAQVHAKLADMIDQSRTHVWIKASHHLIKDHVESMLRAAQRGARVLIILFGQQEDLAHYQVHPSIKVYLHEGGGEKVGMSEWLVTLTRDFEEALTATFGTESHGVFTSSRPVVNMAESLIRHEIYLAEIFSQLGGELEQRFGPALFSLRRQYLPQDQVRELADVIGKAQAGQLAPQKRIRKVAALP